MAIRTFSAQYREEGIEPRKKLKRVRSVKVANLDRLRLSMRREKSRFNRSAMASIDDVTEPSESSSTGISGTSSPNLANYMKDTTSSSARKGSLQASSGNIQSSFASSSDNRTTERQDNLASSAKSASKSSNVPVQEWSDPAGVNIPVIVKPEKSLKRVPSLKHSKKLTSKKSMKIRAKYSQFQDLGISQDEMLSIDEMEFQGNSEINGGGMEFDSESPSVSSSHGQGSMVKTGVQQRGYLQRSRSRKLTRVRSIRSSQARQRLQSRFSSGATELMSDEVEVSNAKPHYMKGTSSQELKKNSDKGLTRTSSLRPLRILAKIPSLRSKRSKARKRPQATSMSGTSVDRATCSSVLKRAELSDGIELHPKSRESEEAISLHVCPYSYCSIHGHRHHHHSPSQPVKEFVSAKRKLISNKKGEKTKSQSRGDVEHHRTKATDSEHSRQMVSAENNPVQEVLNTTTESVTEAEDDGMDFLIKIYAKPRKKWAAEATQNKNAEALDSSSYDQISVGNYEGKLAETLSETSGSEETQGTLNGDPKETYESIKQHHNSNIATLSLHSDQIHLTSKDSAVSSTGDLINILSDKQKYTNMWQLIHQQLISSEASMNEAKEVTLTNEKEGEDGNTCLAMSSLDPEQSEYNNHLSDDVDDQISVTEKLGSHQDAAMKLVQEAVNAILLRDAESYDQQSHPVQEMAKSFVRDHVSTPTASQEETFRQGRKIDGKETTLASPETKHNMKQIGEILLKKEPNAQEITRRPMSKSLSKLRKMFVTAKFIKAMERMKKINPRKPQYLSAEAASENERINLRQLSMNGKKNTEEWMLDNALRQVISRLDPDQQRRVAQLVEAFETVTPEQEEKSNKWHPMKRVLAPGDKLTTSMTGEKKQFVEPEQDISLSYEQVVQQQDGVLVSHKGVPQEQRFRAEHDYQEITTGGVILQESNETNMPDSTLILAETSSKSVYVDSAFNDGGRGDEEPKNSLKAPPQNQNKNSEVDAAGDTTTILYSKKKYRSMWNMIYKHVVTSEAASSENQQVNRLDEEHGDADDDKNISREMDDRESISSDYGMEQNENANEQSGAGEMPELDQSAAIKLVKEALGAILNCYEQKTHLQSIPEPSKVSDDARDLYVPKPISFIEETATEGVKGVEKHTYSELEDKLYQVQNTSLPLQHQIESDELKAPQRKMSKSLSKLKKAIATTRFIKAMERLTKSSPRKSQNLSSNTTAENERVYLRHQSMDGRRKGEEWMLDFALRQVISKMDPDQQRRVERLVEAFEKMHPEQNDKGIPSHLLKGDAADKSELATPSNEAKNCYLKTQQQRSTSVEQVPQKQNDGSLPPTRDASLDRNVEEDHDQQLDSSGATTRDASLEIIVQENYDQQTSATDDNILQETNETAVSKSALDWSGTGLKLPSVAFKLEEPSTGEKETSKTTEFPSPIPTVNSEVRQDGNMATILSNPKKYTSMWHLIHQHVLSNEASTAGTQEVNEVNENEQGDGANKCQTVNDPESAESTQLKNSKVDEDNQSAAFDQSDALNLVKDAINAILQCHQHRPDQQSLKDQGKSADNTREVSDTNAPAFTKEDYAGNRMVKPINSKPEEKLHEVDVTDASLQQQEEAKTNQRKMSTGISKLKRAIETAKFIKAMERLRKINPRKIRHLPAEMTTEEEKVYLRHLSINERKNDEEWMLDYALRKVLSNLSPEEQSKVALIVEAFETVNPRQKGISSVTKSEWDPAHKKQFLQFKQNSSKSNDEDIPPMHMLSKVATLENRKQEDNSVEFSNHKTEMSGKTVESDDSNFNIHCQTRLKGSPNRHPLNKLTVKKEEIDENPRHEPLQHAKDSEQDNEANVAKGIFCEKKKNSSMWHLIYQHVDSISATEAQSKHSERQTNEDPMIRDGASSEMIADADSDDSDASSVTSELNESDATKLVREAINNILNAPEDFENDTASSNETTVSEEGQKASAEEKPMKSLSRGYSKLRKLIICNKFIKAMEKTKKRNPQKKISAALNSDSEDGKSHLKTRAVGEKKGMDEWMLDNVLQKVIAELAPVQQRRVSMLVEAFEKVPNPQQRGKRISSSTTKFLETNTSKEDSEIKEDIQSSMNEKSPDGLGLKLNESTTSSREILTERIPQEICKDKTSGLGREYALDGGNQISNGPCYTTTTSDAIRTLPDTSKDPTDIDGAEAEHVPQEEKTNIRNEVGVQSEEGTSTEEQLARNTEQTSTPPQPDDLKNEWNYGAHKARSLGKSTNLWGLILQKVTTEMLEKDEASNTVEIDVDAERDNIKMLERRTDDPSQASSKTKSCRDMGVQTPTSFEFQEVEAIKLVEEAVEEILLIQDQISDTESVTSSTTSEQEIYSPKNEDAGELSFSATETANIAASPHTVATSEEEKSSSKETLSKSYSTLSKVILCKRFVKAMDKMRKLKAQTQNTVQPSHTEEQGIPSLRQTSASGKTSWDEGMLDNALQKVIGNLAPAKKKRVALLVQAFETVGSQPESTNSSRSKASVS